MIKGKMFADGGARGNPGPAAGGAVVYINDELVAETGKYLGTATNNQAEYTGIIIGLQKAHELGIQELDVRLDSELAVKQLNGQYRVKNPELKILFSQVVNLKIHFSRITFSHVRRELNKAADAVVNRTIDQALGL